MKFMVNVTYGLMRLLGKLPLGFHYACSGFFRWILCSVLHYRKDIVYINLTKSFPELSYKEIQKIADDFYTHFGEIIAEAVWFAGSTPERLRRQHICSYTNPEVLAKTYTEHSNVMLVTSHTGNWELTGGIRSYNTDPSLDEAFNEDHICIAYKGQSSKLWDEVLKNTRTTTVKDFEGLIESKQILRYAVEHRAEKLIYIFIADQKPYGVKTEVGTFLNQHTCGMVAAFKLAHKFHMPVLFMKMVRTERGHYDNTFIPLVDDASRYEPEEIMKMYFRELEKEIRECPANYLWSHKRWNHQ